MPSEPLFYVARLAVHEQWESFVLISDRVEARDRVRIAVERLDAARHWLRQNAAEHERFALILRESAHNLAALLQEQHPELSLLGIDTLQEALLRRPVRAHLAECIGPAILASIWPEGEEDSVLPAWRLALGRKGKAALLLQALTTLHHRLVAATAAASLQITWRPAPQAESTITDVPIPLSQFSTGPTYLYVMNNLPYHAVREVLAFGSFAASEDSPWPTASLKKGSTTGQAQLFPVEMELDPYREPDEQKGLVDQMWRQVSELSDLDADVLDMLGAIWIEQARSPNDFARVDVKKLLRMRGLKPKVGEGGRASGYRPDQKQALFRAIQHISNVFLLIQDTEFPRNDGGKGEGTRSPVRERREVRSRAFVITDIAGNRTAADSTLDIDQFLIRPGVLFGHFLYGPGRQMALLSSKAIQYDRIRQDWEKRLARYLSWQWRNDAMNQRSQRTFLVRTLIENCGKTVDDDHPKRTRQRLEKALRQLAADQVIGGWVWDHARGTMARGAMREPSNWQDYWLDWAVEIEAPVFIRQQYQYILPAPEPAPKAEIDGANMGDQLFQYRKRQKYSQARMAELLGVTQSYYSHLERGTRIATKDMQKRIGGLLEAPV